MKSKLCVIDNALLVALCTLLLGGAGFQEKDVFLILLLCGMKLIVWNQSLEKVHVFSFLTYFIASFYQPKLILFAGFILYDIFWEDKKSGVSIGSVLLALILFWKSYSISYLLLCCFIFSIVLSSYLKKKTMMCEEKEEAFIKMQDNNREENLLLERNNEELVEQQDMSIQLGIANEKNRIARDIHDNVGHLLSSSLIQIGAIQVINQEEKLVEPINSLKDTVEQGMENIRESVHGLYDESLDLEKSMNQLVSKFPNWKIKVDYRLSVDVPSTIKVDVLFLVKEALSNIMKHSNATEVNVKLVEQPAFYRFEVVDNGTSSGINTKEPRDLGMGISSMEERMKQHNGRLTVSKKATSFSILAIIPKESEIM